LNMSCGIQDSLRIDKDGKAIKSLEY